MYGFLDPQNNFEDYLFDSKQRSEKEMIELIEKMIRMFISRPDLLNQLR